MSHKKTPLSILACVLLAACGNEPPAGPGVTNERAAQGVPDSQPAPSVPSNPAHTGETPAPDPTNAVPETAEDLAFREELAAIVALEEAADFSEAFTRCRKARSTFSNHPGVDRLDKLLADLRAARAAAAGLEFAVKNLGSEDAQAGGIAEDELVQAGRTGRILLRQALAEGPTPRARRAAMVLLDMPDRQSLPLIVDWIEANPDVPELLELAQLAGNAIATRPNGSDGESAALTAAMIERLSRCKLGVLSRELTYGLMRSASLLQTEDILSLYTLVREDKAFRVPEIAELFAVLLKERCGGDTNRFSELAADPGAFAFMKNYVETALASENTTARQWAEGTGGIFGTFLRGLHGQYYEGTAFEKLVHEQLDATINVGQRAFPYPDGRQDNISARWTGFIRIDTPGTYVFYSASDDGQRVWVNNKLIIDDWNGHGVVEQSGRIDLAKGLYPYKVEFFQGGGGAAISESWSGPGIAKQIIPCNVLNTKPWKSEIVTRK